MVGDMIALDNLPGVAQVAIQGAKYAAKEIDRRLKSKPSQGPFQYFDKGSMAIISRFRAVALIGKLRLTGVIAWLMWLALHLIYITGFKNRVTALLHWAVSFLGRGRSERTTTEQQIFARTRARAGSSAAPPTWSPTRTRTTPRRRCSRRPGAPSWRRRPPRRPGSPTPASAASRPSSGSADASLLEVASGSARCPAPTRARAPTAAG